ncbi:MAG: methionyl-tRNA synthetase [Flavobacteriaceae bacterium]|jgi:methionyl-tRNA synthetase
MNAKKDLQPSFYITTAIVYPNGDPHIGFAYELFLADVIARYKRQEGYKVHFLTGMDEHGMKVARSADAAGISPQHFVDKKAEMYLKLCDSFNISHDQFIRTSDKEIHWPGAIALWKKMEEKGDIYKDSYEGLYCVGCEAFITEKELDSEGACTIHHKKPEMVSEENHFFKLSSYAGKLKKKIESNEIEIVPERAKNEMLAMIDEGLRDISFSRKSEAVLWGIPVPSDPDQLMYVWCDALSNYISAIGYGRDKESFEELWPADIHVIGKDIVRFHVLFWPAMLMSAGLPLPKKILSHGFINVEGQKMSKSLGNVIDPFEVIETYGTEALRFYMAHQWTPFEDVDFSHSDIIEKYNAHLANGIGNLVSRTLKMISLYFGGMLEDADASLAPVRHQVEMFAEDQMIEIDSIDGIVTHTIIPQYKKYMDNFEIHHASSTLWSLITLLDKYISEYEPYKLIKEDETKTKAVLWNVAIGLDHVSNLLIPFMPETAEAIKKHCGINRNEKGVPVSCTITPLSDPLFNRKK